MRRAEQGHHHHIAGPYLLRYAQEASWREDNRRVSNGDQVHMVSGLAMKRGTSVDLISVDIGNGVPRRKPVLRRRREYASLRFVSEQFPDATDYAFDKSISAGAYPKHLQNLDCRLTLLLTPKECHNQKQRKHRNA
jgi:hypothetical protein